MPGFLWVPLPCLQDGVTPTPMHTVSLVAVLALALALPRRTGFMLPMLEWVCEHAYLDCELVFQDTIPGMLQALVDVS